MNVVISYEPVDVIAFKRLRCEFKIPGMKIEHRDVSFLPGAIKEILCQKKRIQTKIKAAAIRNSQRPGQMDGWGDFDEFGPYPERLMRVIE